MAVKVLILLLVLAGVHGAQWTSNSPPNGHVIYACAGDTVTIPWSYILSLGDVLGDITWLYEGHSTEMVAFYSHGNFFPTPTFSRRVVAEGNAGINLMQVVVGDSGNYSVEIHIYPDSGASHDVIQRSVFLHVTNHLFTTDGVLHVIQTPGAVEDNNTGQLHIQLQCGHFIFSTDPPLQVEWVTPSGHVVNSTDFRDHHFSFLLDNPPQGGNYTCRIPSHQASHACLHGNDLHLAEAKVVVDQMEAQLFLLVGENQKLQQFIRVHLPRLETDNHLLQGLLNQTISDLNHYKGRLEKLEDTSLKHVAFHAASIQPSTPPAGTPLIFRNVQYNQGNGYNSTSGYFSPPFPGTYFLIASTAVAETANRDALFNLYVDNTLISVGYSFRERDTWVVKSSTEGVVHLKLGQRVWIRSDGSSYYTDEFSTFNGFLLFPDPQ